MVLKEFSSEQTIDDLIVRSLLGFSPSLEKYGGVYILYVMDHCFGQSKHHHVLIPKQRAQAIAIIILTSTILTNIRDSIKLDVLAN